MKEFTKKNVLSLVSQFKVDLLTRDWKPAFEQFKARCHKHFHGVFITENPHL
jgi:hypothetical protein